MNQPLFPSTISTQLHFAYFLAVKAMVRKFGKSDGQTGSWCLSRRCLRKGRGGGVQMDGSDDTKGGGGMKSLFGKMETKKDGA